MLFFVCFLFMIENIVYYVVLYTVVVEVSDKGRDWLFFENEWESGEDTITCDKPRFIHSTAS